MKACHFWQRRWNWTVLSEINERQEDKWHMLSPFVEADSQAYGRMRLETEDTADWKGWQ